MKRDKSHRTLIGNHVTYHIMWCLTISSDLWESCQPLWTIFHQQQWGIQQCSKEKSIRLFHQLQTSNWKHFLATWCGVRVCMWLSRGSRSSGQRPKASRSWTAGSWSRTRNDCGLVRWQHFTKPSHTLRFFHTCQCHQQHAVTCSHLSPSKLLYAVPINRITTAKSNCLEH